MRKMKNMDDPKIWFQLGITEHRVPTIEKEIARVIKTYANTGVKLQMIQEHPDLSEGEKLYGAFMVAKSEIQRKLMDATPSFGKGLMMNILGDKKV
jgi:hypothetical protein